MVSWNETVYMCRGLGMNVLHFLLGMRLYMCRESGNETVHV